MSTSKLNAKLMVVGGDAKASEIQLRLPTVIGRGREASVTLPHPLVSRRHTEIFEQNGRLMVRDLGSLNGTFVNNQRIQGDQVLEPNQLLTLGNVTFRAVYEPAELPQQDQVVASQAIELADSVAKAVHDADTEAAADKKVETGAPGGPRSTTIEADRPVAEKTSAVDDSLNALAGLGEEFSQDSVSSISLSRLAELPDPASSLSTIDPDEFQFDEPSSRSSDDSGESDLGSIAKKLPR